MRLEQFWTLHAVNPKKHIPDPDQNLHSIPDPGKVKENDIKIPEMYIFMSKISDRETFFRIQPSLYTVQYMPDRASKHWYKYKNVQADKGSLIDLQPTYGTAFV